MLPAASAAGPAPAIHRPPLVPFGVTFSTLVLREAWRRRRPMTSRYTGLMSQWMSSGDDPAVHQQKGRRSSYCF